MTATYREVCLQTKGSSCEICDSTKNVVAHHVNGDRSDNRMDNLEPMCKSCHRKIHDGIDGFEGCTQKLKPTDESNAARTQLTQRMAEELVSDVDEFADGYGMSRNEAINLLVSRSLTDFQ